MNEMPLARRSVHVVMLFIGLAIVVGAIPIVRKYLAEPKEGYKENARVIRRNVGTPAPDGWVHAVTTPGRFAVDVPGRFSEFTQLSRDVDNAGIDVVGIRVDKEAARFVAVVNRRNDGTTVPPARLEKIAGDLVAQGATRSAEPPAVGGVTGADLTQGPRRMRVYIIAGAIYVLIAENAAPADAERFLSSLQVQ